MPAASKDSFAAKDTLTVGGQSYEIFRIADIKGLENAARLPFSLKVLLENLLRHEDGRFVRAADIAALADWDPACKARKEIAFTPARVLLQDFTGVPCVVDLAAMRDAWLAWNATMPAIPDEAVVSLGYSVKDMPQR